MAKSGKPMPSAAQYGRVVKDLIEQSGLKQSNVADDARMSAGTLSSLVNGGIASAAKVSQHMDTLCGVFGIEREELDRRAMYEGQYGLASARFGMDLGDTLTLWASAVGDGTTVLENKDVHVNFDANAEIVLPSSLEKLEARTVQELLAGKHTFKDNPVLTIFDASWFPFDGVEERPGVKLTLGTTSYALLYSLRHTEQGQGFLSEALDAWELRQEIDPVLSQGLGVSVAILSSDNQLLFGRRFSGIGARAKEIDTGSVEGFSLMDIADQKGTSGINIDIEAVMKRAILEEYGVTKSKIKHIKILNFGFDIGWTQWNFIGLCEADLTAKQIKSRQKSVASQGVEYREIFAVEAVPKVAFKWLSDEPRGIWSCGLATVFYTMVHLHGIDEVESGLDGLAFKISHNLVWN